MERKALYDPRKYVLAAFDANEQVSGASTTPEDRYESIFVTRPMIAVSRALESKYR
ncbi:hypothetical protein QJS04_geneDACA024811 [Acorus gramineus]|uniref:Uncharacterized protein n=1 Tax=Acorus gramineus TaxID=55184 RepID=A0AAV9A361_ACOGR|nr:hypothetical protein QJS04_geneDACA024811 [Acorus gramineus]